MNAITWEQLLVVGNHVRLRNGKVVRLVAQTGEYLHWFSADKWGLWTPIQARESARLERANPTLKEVYDIQDCIDFAPPDVLTGGFKYAMS